MDRPIAPVGRRHVLGWIVGQEALGFEASIGCGELGDRVRLERIRLKDDVARFALINGEGVVEPCSSEGEPARKTAESDGEDVDGRLSTQHQAHLIWRLT